MDTNKNEVVKTTPEFGFTPEQSNVIMNANTKLSEAVMKASEEKLYTVPELASLYGVSNDRMQKKLHELKQQPEVPMGHNEMGHRTPALYSIKTLKLLQQQQQQLEALAAAKSKAAALIGKIKDVKNLDEKTEQAVITSALTEIGTQQVFDNYIERIRNDHSAKATEEIIANAAGFIKMLLERAVIMKDMNAESEAKIKELDELLVGKEVKLLEQGVKIEELEDMVGLNKTMFSTQRVMKLNGHTGRDVYDWRKLKAFCLFSELPIGKVFDRNYGEVNTYHIDAWKKVYPNEKYGEDVSSEETMRT